MPKKTKREKILAEGRRSYSSVSHPQQSDSAPQSVTPSQDTGFHFRYSSSPPENKKTIPALQTDLAVIKRDLTKTIILALVAVTIELLLHWRFRF